MDRGVWQAIVHGITKNLDTTERLNTAHTLGTQYHFQSPEELATKDYKPDLQALLGD